MTRPERRRSLRGLTTYVTLTLVGGTAAAMLATRLISAAPPAAPATARPISAQALFPAPPPVQKTVDVYDQPPPQVMSGSPGGEREGDDD